VKTSCTPAPVWLNGWKHHLEFVCGEVLLFKCVGLEAFKKVCLKLKIMGASLSDFYTGTLSPNEIAEEICNELKKLKVFAPHDYKNWIEDTEKKFRLVMLSDHSKWTLTQCDDDEYYLHIHPSRYSKHTIRIKGNTLRTAAAMLAYEEFSSEAACNLKTINLVRKEFLHMSPIDERHMEGILRTVDFLKERCSCL
jgi:hypothetical protein